MRNWRKRTRYNHRIEFNKTLNSEHSFFWSGKTKINRKHQKRKRRQSALWEQELRWESQGKTHYEDCSYHPCLITLLDIEKDDIEGVSLIDGTSPRSCSLRNCGVVFFTKEEAEERAAFAIKHGMDHYLHVYFDKRPATMSKSVSPSDVADYTWTRDDYEVGDVDAIEVAGIIRHEDVFVERSDTSQADLFSVFIHIPEKGADCVADRNTFKEAMKFAEDLGAELSVPVHNFTHCTV